MASSQRLKSKRIAQVSNVPSSPKEDPLEASQNRITSRIAPVQPDSPLALRHHEIYVPFAEGTYVLEWTNPVDTVKEEEKEAPTQETEHASSRLSGQGSEQLSKEDSEPMDILEEYQDSSCGAQLPLPSRGTTTFALANSANQPWLWHSDHYYKKSVVRESTSSSCFFPPIVAEREATVYEEIGIPPVRATQQLVQPMLSDTYRDDVIEEEPNIAPQVLRTTQGSSQHFRFQPIGASRVEQQSLRLDDFGSMGTEDDQDIDTYSAFQPVPDKSPRSADDEVTESTAENSARSFAEQLSHDAEKNETWSAQASPWYVEGVDLEVANDFPPDEETTIHEREVSRIVESYPTIQREARDFCNATCDSGSHRDHYSIIDIDSLKDQPAGNEVALQVYALSERVQRIGLPVFHVGVEVYAREYFFTLGGIDRCTPRTYACQVHSQSVPLGRTKLTQDDVEKVIEDLKQEWFGFQYAFLGRNCQDFAVTFCKILGVADAIPIQCCRFANFSEVLPPLVISGIREADQKVAQMANMIGGTKPVDKPAEKVRTKKLPYRLSVVRQNELPLEKVVLPLETEATLDI